MRIFCRILLCVPSFLWILWIQILSWIQNLNRQLWTGRRINTANSTVICLVSCLLSCSGSYNRRIYGKHHLIFELIRSNPTNLDKFEHQSKCETNYRNPVTGFRRNSRTSRFANGFVVPCSTSHYYSWLHRSFTECGYKMPSQDALG